LKKGRVGVEKIAVIADIARHRQHRESKTLPLINADQERSGNLVIGTSGDWRINRGGFKEALCDSFIGRAVHSLTLSDDALYP
jgi:hypothetical protein